MHGQLTAAEMCFRLGIKHSEPISDFSSQKHHTWTSSNLPITPRLTKLLGDCLFAQDKFQEASTLYRKVTFLFSLQLKFLNRLLKHPKLVKI